MTASPPLVQTRAGAVRGVWRGGSAAFLGIPFAQAPVGALRFAAPQPTTAWQGILDAAEPGPTPQRRPFGDVTTIPEPSYPGEATLNLNVFTPAPRTQQDGLPVLVWIHGGGFFAGSPSSPWYDGASYNRDGVVTVSLSYRLGFDGFGWIADAPTNRGLRDLVVGLEWVRDNIAAFGGDPGRVTIAGQSAGGAAALALLTSPLANGLFSQVIAHSAPHLSMDRGKAEQVGRALALAVGVEPTRAGWSALSEDDVLDAQAALMAPPDEPPVSGVAYVREALASGRTRLPFVPLTGDDLLPDDILHAVRSGSGFGKPVLAGTVAHEFTLTTMGFRAAWSGSDPVQALTEGGLRLPTVQQYEAGHPELTSTADICGQLDTELTFRIPLLAFADSRPDNTWLYDFRWPAPGLGLSTHCLELPFTWDLLGSDGVTAVAGENPPQELADAMHSAWVRFVKTGDPGWPMWRQGVSRVFGAEQAETYASTRILARAPDALT